VEKRVARQVWLFDTRAAVETRPRPFLSHQKHLAAVGIFLVVLAVVFQRAIFFHEVLAPVDLLARELPWSGVVPATQLDNPATADVVAIFQPWKHFVHAELRAGRFPLWCTHVGCGYPLAGAGDLKLFGLTTFFLWLCPLQGAALGTFVAQLLIAMTGMYALLVALRCRWLAAVFGGLVFGLNSALFQHLEFEHIVGGLMFLPWICAALWRTAQERRFGLWAGVLLGLTIFNGSVQSLAMVWVSSAAFAGVVLRRRAVAVVGVMTFVGAAVGALALLPNLELILHNVRVRYERIAWWELVWKRPLTVLPWLVGQLNPDGLGNTQTFDLVRALGQVGMRGRGASLTDLRVYGGLMAVGLAVLGLRGRREVRTLGLWMLGVPVVMVVISPLFLIVYFRYFAATGFGLALLAALGMDRLMTGDGKLTGDIRKLLAALVIMVVLTVAIGLVVTSRQAVLTEVVARAGERGTSFYRADKELLAEKTRATVANFSWQGPAVWRFTLMAVLTGGVLVGAVRWRGAGILILVLNTADTVELAWRTFPSVPAQVEYPSTPALAFLRSQAGLFRVASGWNIETELPTARPNLLLPYQLDDARVYHSLVPKNPLYARQDWDGLNVRYFVTAPTGTPPAIDWPRVYHGEVSIFENPRVRPRVEIEDGHVEIESYRSGHIALKVTAERAGWLRVRERAYPGWVATVDGQRVAWQETDGLWLAVPVAGGAHAVTLNYRPNSVTYGALISLVALISVLAAGRFFRTP